MLCYITLYIVYYYQDDYYYYYYYYYQYLSLSISLSLYIYIYIHTHTKAREEDAKRRFGALRDELSKRAEEPDETNGETTTNRINNYKHDKQNSQITTSSQMTTSMIKTQRTGSGCLTDHRAAIRQITCKQHNKQ